MRALGMALIAVVACYASREAHAQVFEINGGNSSLYEAEGGSISMEMPGFDTTIGAGMIGGHFTYGAKMEKVIGPSVYSAGDQQIDFLLPTDVFDPSHYLFARGFGLKTKREGMDLFAFGGTISTLYETPIFEGAGFGTGMGFLSLRRQITPKWQIWSDTIISSKMTQITAVQFEPAHRVVLAAAGGVGANQPYAAASLNLSRRWADVLASYIAAGPNFRRVVVSSPIQAEPDKGNLLVTVRPTHFLTLSGDTQSYIVPNITTNQNESSSVRSGSATLQVAKAILSGTVYDSSAMGETNHAAAFTAARDFTHWVRVMSDYMVSKPKGMSGSSSLFTTVTETLNQHISVNESISNSNGQTSLLYGGSLLTNLLTVSANYETFYVPVNTASPFQESLMLDVSLHLFGRATLHGASFVGPTGQMLYTATADALAVHGMASLPGEEQPDMGNSVLRVQVVDPENHPVEGAALLVDARPVFTDQDGYFALREHKPRQHKLRVLTDQFLDGGNWAVRSMPAVIRSSEREKEAAAVVVVSRIPRQRAAGTEAEATQSAPAPGPGTMQ